MMMVMMMMMMVIKQQPSTTHYQTIALPALSVGSHARHDDDVLLAALVAIHRRHLRVGGIGVIVRVRVGDSEVRVGDSEDGGSNKTMGGLHS